MNPVSQQPDVAATVETVLLLGRAKSLFHPISLGRGLLIFWRGFERYPALFVAILFLRSETTQANATMQPGHLQALVDIAVIIGPVATIGGRGQLQGLIVGQEIREDLVVGLVPPTGNKAGDDPGLSVE